MSNGVCEGNVFLFGFKQLVRNQSILCFGLPFSAFRNEDVKSRFPSWFAWLQQSQKQKTWKAIPLNELKRLISFFVQHRLGKFVFNLRNGKYTSVSNKKHLHSLWTGGERSESENHWNQMKNSCLHLELKSFSFACGFKDSEMWQTWQWNWLFGKTNFPRTLSVPSAFQNVLFARELLVHKERILPAMATGSP